MPDAPMNRSDLETTAGLECAIRGLPPDAEVPKGTQGYNRYTTQHAHWIGWLSVTPGAGSYARSPEVRARVVYNRLVEPQMLLWLIEASKVDPGLVSKAKRAVSALTTLAGKSKAIREVVPYSVVADALWQNLDKRRRSSV